MSALHAQPTIGLFFVVWAECTVLTFFSKTCRGQRNSQPNSGRLHTTMNGYLQCIALRTKRLQPQRKRSTSTRPSSRMSQSLVLSPSNPIYSAAQRALESSESSHKQTTAELQRTRTALQGIRTTHQQELKKKDKELERMARKWNKLSDAQIKLSTVPSGLKCVNVGIVHGSELIPRTPSLLDIALDDAEKAREQLIEEVGRLRRLVVKVVNQIQAVLFHVRGFVTDKNEQVTLLSNSVNMRLTSSQPIEHSIPTLFPMYPPTHAHDVLSATLRSLRDTLAALPLHIASAPIQSISSSSTNTSTRTPESADPKTEEVARLHATIAQLKQEIGWSRRSLEDALIEYMTDQAHTQAQHQASQTRALFDNFTVPQQETPSDVAEMSMELMTTSMADAERERLEKIRQELDNEREKFTQAAVQLGRERTALEVGLNP